MNIRHAAFLFLLLPVLCYGKAGPEIPRPKITITEAVKIAKNKLLQESKLVDSRYFKAKEYIVISVSYTNRYRKKLFKEWGWVIVFTHPLANDHNAIYRVISTDSIELLGVTE